MPCACSSLRQRRHVKRVLDYASFRLSVRRDGINIQVDIEVHDAALHSQALHWVVIGATTDPGTPYELCHCTPVRSVARQRHGDVGLPIAIRFAAPSLIEWKQREQRFAINGIRVDSE